MNQKAFWLVVLANVVYGCSFMATTVAIDVSEQSVFGILAARFTLAFLALLILAAFRVLKVDYRGKPVHKLIGIALLYPGLYFLSEAISLTQVNSAIVGVVIGMAPITTALLMMIFFRKKQTLQQVAWMVMSIVGVIVINGTEMSESGLSVVAIVCLALALLSFSAYSIGIHSAGEQFTAAEITLFMLFAGTIMFNILDAVFRSPFAYWKDLSNSRFLLAILFLALLTSGASSLALNYGLCRLPPVTVSVLNNVTSVVAVLCGLLFLHESLTWRSVVGCVLIVLGCTGYSLSPSNTCRDFS